MSNGNLFNFFAYLRDGRIRRIPLNRDLQQNLSNSFEEKLSEFLPDNDNILSFTENVNYKLDEDEVFVIDDFDIPEEIAEALTNPVNIENINTEDYESIRAIFCGKRLNDDYVIIFTTFDSRKIIKSSLFKR